MPLTPHGQRQLSRLEQTYDPATARRVLYASKNKGRPGFVNIDRTRGGHGSPSVRHKRRLIR